MGTRDYLDALVAQFDDVPAVAGAVLATEIYKGLVMLTHIDSGQAALNWHIQPYTGDAQFGSQEMLWGYGNVAPTPPAGMKWSKGANTDHVLAYLFEQGVHLQLSIENTPHFDGIMVYNPITPGFSGFSPGDDTYYEQYALSDASGALDSIIQEAMETMETRLVEQFSFLSRG